MSQDLLQRPDEDQDRVDRPNDLVNSGADELESLYNEPAVADDQRNTNSPPPTADDLENLYNKPSRSDEDKNLSPGGGEEADDGDSLLNKMPAGSALKGVSNIVNIARNHRKKGVTGGVVGLIAAIVFAAGLFLQGPLQFVHIAQLLNQFHFGGVESFSDERGTNLWRFAKNPGFDPDSRQARRLSSLGNKFADATELKINQRGISSDYDRIGNFDGYTIDPEIYENGRYRNNPEGLRRSLANEGFDASVTNNGSVRAPKQSGVFKSRRLINFVAAEAGYGKVLGKLSTRTLRTRANVSFKPIKRANEWGKLQFTVWLDEFRQRVNNGDTGVRPRATDYGSEENLDNSQSNDPEVSQNADSSSNNVDLDRNSLDALKTQGLRAGGVATTVVAGTCIIYGISQNYDAISFENVNLPLMRFGMEFVSLGSQIQAGDDIALADLEHISTRLTDPETGESWAAAKSIQHELGQPATGPDIAESARPAGEANPVSEFLGRVPGVSGFCKVLGSPAGILAGLALDIASGPVSAIVAIADEIGGFSEKFISYLTNWIADDPVNVETFVGPGAGNAANYGIRLAAREVFTSLGGREQSQTETSATNRVLASHNRYDQRQTSFSDRLFDISSANSFSTRLALTIPRLNLRPSLIGPSAQTFLARLLGSPFSQPQVLAAQTGSVGYDYGFNLVGFSEEERTDPRFEDPYQNADLIFDKLPELNDEYGPSGLDCFGVDVKSDGRVVQLGRDRLPQKSDCLDDNEDLLRFRFYVADYVTAASGACLEGDSQACSEVGASGGNTTLEQQFEGSEYTGSAQFLAQQILDNDNIIFDNGDSGRIANSFQQVADTGQASLYTRDNNQRVPVDTKLLGLILELADQTSQPIRISSLTTGDHTDGSLHYSGKGVDIGNEELANEIMPFLFENRQRLQINELLFNNSNFAEFNIDDGRPTGTPGDGSDHIHVGVF